MRGTGWRQIPINLTELCLDTTLRCGQSFRWKKHDDIWSCALHGRILSLRQDSTYLHYRATFPDASITPRTLPSSIATSGVDQSLEVRDTEALVYHYLNLDSNLTTLYEQWSEADANFKKKAPRFAGVRILKQDAWEALIGFICSSNNNISRISQMAGPPQSYKHMQKLCLHYGPLIGHIDSQPFHDLPSSSALTDPKVEAHLRQLGFGYRAKYIHQTAVIVSQDHEEGWLDSLRNPESPIMGHEISPAGNMLPRGREGYRLAHEELLSLQGVGPKVADCVCLMGLGWGEAVPVDTHVWQIAQRDYRFGKGKHSSLTKATYDAVGDHFRRLWGKEAGWAHSVLFTADLRAFSAKTSTQIEIKEVQELKGTKGEKENGDWQDASVATQTITTTQVKREFNEEDKDIVQIETTKRKRTRRR
ncbi:MAG: hypothetical protein Q9167_002820 [Letrouitia subvulpina]